MKDIHAHRHIKRVTYLKRWYKRFSLENLSLIAYNEKCKGWVNETQLTETTKFKKFQQDYHIMQVSLQAEWKVVSDRLEGDQALLGLAKKSDDFQDQPWTLDFTESRARMRKKLRMLQKAKPKYLSKEEHVIST